MSTSQEIPYILCNPKVCYRVYNSPVPSSGSVKEKSGSVNKILERPQLMKLIGDYWYNYFIVYDTAIRSPWETCAASTSWAWSA